MIAHSTRRKTAIIAVVASTVTALLVGGVSAAVATAAANGKQVTTCYNKKTGALRLARRCARGEGRLILGQVGPQGPAGVQGVQGVPGQKGDIGPSDGFFASNTDAATVLTGTYQRVATLTVPTGNYIVSGTVTVGTSGGGGLWCGEGTPSILGDQIWFEQKQTMPATAALNTMTVTGFRRGGPDVYLECKDITQGTSTPGPITVHQVALSAVKVSTVTGN